MHRAYFPESESPGVGPAEALQVILTVVKFETQQDVQGQQQILSTRPGSPKYGAAAWVTGLLGQVSKLSAPSIFLPEGDNRSCGSDLTGFF